MKTLRIDGKDYQVEDQVADFCQAAVKRADASEKDRSELLSITGKSAVSEALAVVQGFKAAADQLPAMQESLKKLQDEKLASERDQLIAKAKADGKLAPALEDWARAQPIAALQAYLEVAPPVVPIGKEKQPPAEATVVTLSNEELEVAKQLRVDPKVLAERKAAKK